MRIEKCTLEDIPQLAVLNKQLIDDEKSDNRVHDNHTQSGYASENNETSWINADSVEITLSLCS